MNRSSIRSDFPSVSADENEDSNRPPYRNTNRCTSAFKKVGRFIWNKDKKLLCGITLANWVLLLIYYVIFIAIVCGLFFLTLCFGMYILLDLSKDSELRISKKRSTSMDLTRWKYKNGQWIWDNFLNRLIFGSNAPAETPRGPVEHVTISQAISKVKPQTLGCSHEHLIIKFRDSIDPLEQVRFRRYYRRRTTPSEADVVTIQDVRDVVLFSIPPNQLSIENIRYFHTPSMDSFLRALIIYFQYFMQVWDEIMARKEEGKNKLYQPSILEKDKKTHDELADLRSMVSKAYFTLLIGANDTKQFHHIKSNKSGVSQGEKDVRFIEFLYQVCTRVVWIALLKRNPLLIATEVNRMLRSDAYNIVNHKLSGTNSITPILRELDSVLYGQCNAYEQKLLQRSNVGKELFFGEHDYRMLAIGYGTLKNVGTRIKYLEIAYSAPEEYLVPFKVPVGILGYPREDFDDTLTLRFARNDDGSVKVWPKMILPEASGTSIQEYTIKPKVKNIVYKKKLSQTRKDQCTRWFRYVTNLESYDSFADLKVYGF